MTIQTERLLALIANGIDQNSALYAQIEARLKIADIAEELADSLSATAVVDETDRADIAKIINLRNQSYVAG